MKCIVTGAAGFIGSHLCEHLLHAGHDVIGVDAFIPYYPRTVKEHNLRESLAHARYQFSEMDLRQDALDGVFVGAEVVFHLAAMPGLAQSWTDFHGYWTCNVLATQRLLEAARRMNGLKRFIYASTSSVYGRFASGDETLTARPVSPYGVTKLAGENLARAYGETYGLPVTALRFFSVYGPRQRPDMAYHRFIKAMLRGEPLQVYGDGMQIRGNTFITDCVRATAAAVEAVPGEVYNIGGGEAASVWDIIHKLEAIAGRKAKIQRDVARPGDQRYTFADTNKLRRHLGWEPLTTLEEGLARQWEWQEGELMLDAPARDAA
jgi:nucleoside-diphosphate-sugar epimerase